MTENDVIHFANVESIPLLFIFDENRLIEEGNYPTFVCFERDYEQVKMFLPVTYILESVPDQIEFTTERLQLEYKEQK